MITDVIIQNGLQGLGTYKRVAYLRCDHCGISFSRRFNSIMFGINHYDTRVCQHKALKKDGIANQQLVRTNLERYGTEYTLSNPDVQEKRKQTCLEKYGVTTPLSRPGLQSQYGKLGQRSEVRKKRKATLLQRYGVTCVFKIPDVAQKAQSSTTRARRRASRKKTALEIYGVASIFHISGYHQKYCNKPQAILKRHQTMKRNGSFHKSKPEDQMYELLCRKYESENVKRQFFVKRWPIDCYVRSIDTYFQLDGNYWHGMDRSVEEIMEFKNKRDRQIYKKILIDKAQNEWFTNNNMKLIRIPESIVFDEMKVMGLL